MEEPTRLHRAWFVAAALGAALVAGACLLLPQHAAAFLPIAPKPLHARCIGAVYLAAVVGLVLCWLDADIAAVRIPMVLATCGAAALALAAVGVRTLPWVWLGAHTAVAVAGGWLWWLDESVQAPAERPDRGLLALAAGALAPALALAFAPQYAASWWPWPMPPPVAPFYAAPLWAFAVAAGLAALERRRGARRIALWAQAVLCVALLVASLLHRASFAGTSAWVWFGLIGTALVLVLQRLRGRTRPAL